MKYTKISTSESGYLYILLLKKVSRVLSVLKFRNWVIS